MCLSNILILGHLLFMFSLSRINHPILHHTESSQWLQLLQFPVSKVLLHMLQSQAATGHGLAIEPTNKDHQVQKETRAHTLTWFLLIGISGHLKNFQEYEVSQKSYFHSNALMIHSIND